MAQHMDVANGTFPTENQTPEVYTYGERVFVAIVVLLVVLMGSIGNTAVILAVAFSRKLQNSTYVFVTNLAVCDLLTCLFLPWSAVALLAKDGWPLPRAEWLCSAAAFMVFACVITSMFNLAAIGFNRYILVCRTFETFTKTFSIRNICLMVAVSWLVPFSVVLALPLAGIGQLGYDEFGGNGCTDIDAHPNAKLYQWVQVLASVFPLAAIVVCYILIFMHVKRHFKRQKKRIRTQNVAASVDISASMDLDDHGNNPQRKYRPNPAKNITTTNVSITSENERDESASQLNNGGPESGGDITSTYNTTIRKQRKLKRQQLKVTGRLFLIVCAFFFCITPYCIAISIEGIPQRWIIYTSLLTITNSAINPIIYSLTHPHFKQIFGAMFKCRFRDIPQPSDFLRRFLGE